MLQRRPCKELDSKMVQYSLRANLLNLVSTFMNTFLFPTPTLHYLCKYLHNMFFFFHR